MTAKKTEHDQVKEILLGGEGKPQVMLEAISDYISIVDKDLNIVWANKPLKKFFGEDIIGKKCYAAYRNRKEPCEPYPCHALETFQDGKVHERDLEAVDKEGKVRYFHSISNVALKDKAGKCTTVIEITRDITERKQAEEARRQSEHKFLKVFESNAAIMAISTLEEGRIIDINKEFTRIFGFKRKEVIGKTTAEINLYEDYRQRDVLRKAIKEKGYVHNLEIRVRIKNGEMRHVLLSAELMDVDNQKCILTITHDITELKQMDKALQQSEETHRLLLDNADAAICYFDTEGNVKLLNEKAAENLGWETKGFTGKSIYDMFPKETADFHLQRFAKIIKEGKGGKGGRFEDEFELPQGKRWFLTDVQPMKDSDGRITGIQIIANDITERKAAEEQIRATLQEKEVFLGELREQEQWFTASLQ
ncbi:PAS domain S-box protein, partial [Planctomycetota bacterium]